MIFTALTPILLRSTDLADALAFYTDTLDFRLDSGGADAGWASLRHGSLALMLAARQATDAAAAGFPGSLYFRTDDVDAWWQRLQPRARIAYPLEDFAYGMRELAIHDPDGHLLQFGQALCR